MSLVSPFLTILVLNVNRLRSPIQRIGQLNGLKKNKTRVSYIPPARDSLLLQGNIGSEEKTIPWM